MELLTNNGPVLLCAPACYVELENRRKRVLSGCKTGEQMVRLGRIDFSDSKLRELRILKLKIADRKKRLSDLERDGQQAKKELVDLEEKSAAVIASMKAKEQKQAN